MLALILADGDAPTRGALDAAWPGWADDVGFVIAADGGARHAGGLEVTIDLWVGDGDSIGEEALASLIAAGVPAERSRPDKDASDTELAVRAALQRGVAGMIIVGAIGGSRIDHALANVGLLAMPELVDRPAIVLDARSRITLLRSPRPDGTAAEASPLGRPGDTVSLLPIGTGVDGVTTRGLAYPLSDEPLLEGSTRGLSNVVVEPGSRVVVRRGLLLIVETPARLSP
jgi:thiamine pyrophosphokinase